MDRPRLKELNSVLFIGLARRQRWSPDTHVVSHNEFTFTMQMQKQCRACEHSCASAAAATAFVISNSRMTTR